MRPLRSHKLILLFSLLLWGGNTEAQVVDSIKHYYMKKPSFMMKFDTRHSFISSRHGRIFGMKFGVDHGDRLKYGGGVNWLSNANDFDRELQFPKADTSVTGRMNLWFLSPFLEYTFYSSKHWELTMPIRMGVGFTSFNYYDPLKEEQVNRTSPVLSYEPILSGQFKFWRYFGVGMGLGYRLMLLDKNLIPQGFDQKPYRFSSAIYIFRFNIFFGRMYRDIFPKKKD